MATSDTRRTVLQIINEVQRKLFVNQTTNMDETKMSMVLVDFLNDVIDDVSDYGDWPQMFRETLVTAQSSVEQYEINVSAPVKNVYEIHWSGVGGVAVQVAPLEVRDVQDIRRLQKTRGHGEPRQFAIVGVSGVNPTFRTYPIPGSNEDGKTFDIAYYEKPRFLDATVTADGGYIPAFPARMLIQGLYAKALLEESGGEPTQQYQTATMEYMRMRRETYNRLTADTGNDVFIVPTGGNY